LDLLIWTTASKLLVLILDRINNLPHPRSEEAIVSVIHTAFCKVDQEIMDEVKKAVDAVNLSMLDMKSGSFLDKLPSAYCRAGCCAVIAVLADDKLFVANVG
jgi:hypothetical protein